MDYIVLILEWAFHEQKPAARDYYPVSVVEIRASGYHVGDAGLIFH